MISTSTLHSCESALAKLSLGSDSILSAFCQTWLYKGCCQILVSIISGHLNRLNISPQFTTDEKTHPSVRVATIAVGTAHALRFIWRRGSL